MKRLLSVLIVGLVLRAQPASAAPAVVQVKASGACAGSCSATLTGSTVAGNTIIVFVSEFYSLISGCSFTLTVSDGSNTYGTAYTHENAVGCGPYSPSIYVRYVDNAASVGSVTVNDSGGQYCFSVVEVSGLATSSSVDQAAGYHLDTTTTAYTAAAVTTTTASEIVFGVHVANTSGTFSGTPSGSFTTTVMNSAQNPSMQVQHQIVAATGTYTSAGTWTASVTTDSAMVSFKAAGGGGGGTSPAPCALRLLGLGCEVHP